MFRNNIIIALLIGILFISSCSTIKPDYILTASFDNEEYIPGILTPTYEFNNQLPGPLIKGVVGEEISILARNNIDEPITIHWHGMQLPNSMDGVPKVTQDEIAPNSEFLYTYTPVNPGIYWYHSHVEAHKQVEMGLQGPIVIEDPNNKIITDSDSVLVLDDVSLDEFGNYRSFDLNYMHGRFGNIFLVNGEENPTISVKGSTHRFRLINTANARSFYLNFANNNITVIGEDIGYVQAYNLSQLAIHPGERYDVIVTTNNSFTIEYHTSRSVIPLTFIDINEKYFESEKTIFPLINSNSLPEEAWSMKPTLSLDLKGTNEPGHGLVWSIGGANTLTNPKTFKIEEGKLEKFVVRNTQGQSHPMHLHGQKFQVISRNGIEQPRGKWKDTIMVGNREVVEIAFIAEGKGEWVFHCHILEHARAGMLTSITID